ncbi:hypothetical protein MRB53_023079 [Persea americana]|uniref:Uncharacterized protein n=1 Tax=Persea americana TaxID=3435 RepID=A0ACC2L8C4_PERAE|nr:hypothetical protein MRB53_023079 [Persea americana]
MALVFVSSTFTQNAEDNEYLPGVSPTLEFTFTTEDITGTGAPATLLVCNNEKGFSMKNIESICSIGQSTKKGKREFGFIGEKGIGFKSVFLVTTRPYIFSNGYQIRLSEEPDLHCGIGYIVPEWVNGRPTVSDIHRVYGSHKVLPTIVIVLPLRPEKVQAVKKQLSGVHPELLLFLSKIRKLSIQENSKDPLDGVDVATAIFLSHETDLGIKKDINGDFHQLSLSAQEGTDKIVKEFKYYMWRQRFPVKPENIVDERRGLKEWVICLAFPFGERLRRGESSSDCVGYAFSEAVVAARKSDKAAPVSSMIKVFDFLPANASPYVELERVRESIRNNLETKDIIPYQTFSTQKAFCKPTEAGRLIPAFRNILSQLKAQGVPLESISSQRKHICHSALDLKRFDPALDFLGVQCFYDHWYAKCIQDCDLILKASENIYVELLVFIMKNWQTQSDHIGYMATLKYIDQHGNVALCSINSASRETYKICFGLTYGDHTWLSKCNMEFGWKEMYFLPNATWSALQRSQNSDFLKSALKSHARMKAITLLDFFIIAVDSIRREKNSGLVISFTHFLCHSLSKNLISSVKISEYCPSIPVVDRFGRVNLQRDAVLVPASGSKWGKLMISNPWTNENYVELGKQYARCCKFAGECSSKEMLHNFMVVYIKAKDIPELCPPGAHFPLAYSYLTGEQAFLLLDWIRHLRTDNSLRWNKFIENIQGKWLKTYAGYNSSKECLLSAEEERSIFAEMGNFHSHIPIIDEQFYESKIRSYESDLKYLGVKFGLVEAYPMIVSHLMSLTQCRRSTKEAAIPLMKLMTAASDSILWDSKWDRFSKIADLPFIDDSYYGSVIYSFKDELAMMGVVVGFTKWSNVFTARMKLPKNPNVEASRYALSLLEQIRLLNKVPLIDETFYKGRIGSFKEELKSLGVNVNFDDTKEKIFGQFKSLSSSCDLSKHKTLSALNCLKHFKGKENIPFEEFMNCLSNEKWQLTWHGYKCPKDSILFDSEWGPISEIADLPFIDDAFYGNCISSYRDELKMMGVAVVLRDGCQFVAEGLKFPKEPEAITAASALSLLECIRILLAGSSNSALTEHFLLHMKSKWILTHMGYKTPDQSFLFNSSPSSVISKKWGGSLELEDAPFINEEFYGTDISLYREELKEIGVNVEAGEGCSSLAELLSCHSNFSAIRRIYRYLNKFKWMPPSSEKSDLRIWIPDHNGTHGEWVQPSVCVLSDVDNLFGASFLVLDKYYDRPLLPFFSMVFGVAKSPTTHDYLKLWNNWESRPEHQITTHECCSFWKYICSIWHANGGVAIVKGITKLPANTADGAVQLIDKRDLFIPDDLQPVQIFAEASANPLFVWCPPPSLPTIPVSKLYMIYSSLGVQKISASVQKGEDFSMDYSLLNVLPTTEVIQKGLLKLVLAFLADVPVCTTVRHEIAQCLLKLSILETTEPIMVSYSLVLPSDKRHVNAKARKMVYWEKTSNKLIIQTPNKSDNKTIMEFACQFATVVSEGLLLKIMTSLIQQRKIRAPIFDGLYKLVRLGYFLDFNVDSIECLLKIENLEVLTEDEDFIASAFAVYDTALVVYKRKPRSVKEMSAPIAEKDRTKRRKR